MVSKPKSDFNTKKETARNIALEIISEIDTTVEFDAEAMNQAIKGLSSVKNLFGSMKKHKVLESLKVKCTTKKEPWNKKIDPQRNFFSTKSSDLERPRVRMTKPSEEEKENVWSSSIWQSEATTSKALQYTFLRKFLNIFDEKSKKLHVNVSQRVKCQ